MKKMIAVLVLSGLAASAQAGTAYYTGESSGGYNKICYYEYLGSVYAITISSIAICPLTIEV